MHYRLILSCDRGAPDGDGREAGFSLENWDRVVVKEGKKRPRYSSDGCNCRTHIATLAVQALMTWDGSGTPSRMTEPKSQTTVLDGPSSTIILNAG